MLQIHSTNLFKTMKKGICVPLIYISEFCVKQGISKIQSLYILGLIGVSQGLGRIISTIIYKVNESNPKSRIFAHDLTLILAGLSVLMSTVLCDTPFSCCVFAIAFGSLFGWFIFPPRFSIQ